MLRECKRLAEGRSFTAIGLPLLYSPHSYRVTAITDLLE